MVYFMWMTSLEIRNIQVICEKVLASAILPEFTRNTAPAHLGLTKCFIALNCNSDVLKKAGVNLTNASVIYFQKIVT